MSRFAVLYEDPDYEYTGEDMEQDFEVQGKELAKIVDGWIRESVAKKQQPQEELSPFITINS